MANPLSPGGLLDLLLRTLGRAPDGDEPRGPDGDPPDEHERREAAQLALAASAVLGPDEHRAVINMFGDAAKAHYADGRSKRTAYLPVELGGRRVFLMLHQTGFTWKPSNPKHPNITGHGVIRADAAILELHPSRTRLVAGNRIDREPYHGIHLEVMTNAEGLDGSGRWYRPDLFGEGRATDAQLDAAWHWVQARVIELDRLGIRCAGILPHITTGRDSHGRPNRTIDPGSRIWSEVGERAGAELGLAVPRDGWSLGGAPVPKTWHGPHWSRCARFIA